MGIDLIVLLVLTLVSVAFSVTSQLLAPKPDIEDLKPSGLGDYDFPTSLESRYIPVVYGTTEVQAPNVIWYGDFSSLALDTGGTVVAYQYYLGLDLALCYGPLDAISALRIDDKYVFQQGVGLGPDPSAGDVGALELPYGGYTSNSNVSANSIYINQRNFFGGPKSGGGLLGTLNMYFGTDNQQPDPYVVTQESTNDYTLDDSGTPTDDSDDITISQDNLVPGYAGLAHAVWTGGLLGESATLRKWTFTVHRYPDSLTSSFKIVNQDAHTGQGDANPIHCLYEILTNTQYGLGVSQVDLNRDSFLEAAEKCFYENIGFGYTVDNTKSAETIINLISTQIGGQLTTDNQGRIAVVLFRDNYDRVIQGSGNNYMLDYSGGRIPLTTIAITTTASDLDVTPTTVDGVVTEILIEAGTGTPFSSLSVDDWVVVNGIDGPPGPYLVIDVDVADDAFTIQTRQGVGQTAASQTSVTLAIEKVATFKEFNYFTQEDILEVTTSGKQAWDETFNTLQLTYIDKDDDFKQTVATAFDNGNLAIRNGVQSIKKLDLQGIRSRVTAAQIAQRELRNLSYPMITLSLKLPRKASNTRPGDLIAVYHPDFGLGSNDGGITPLVVRVLEVGLPGQVNGEVVIKGIQDTFQHPDITETVNVGGDSEIRAAITTTPSDPTDIISIGLPAWWDAQLRKDEPENFLNSSPGAYRAVHLIGAPDRTTNRVETYVNDAGTFVSITGEKPFRNVMYYKNPDDFRGEFPATTINGVTYDPSTLPTRYFDPADSSDVFALSPGAGEGHTTLDPMFMNSNAGVDYGVGTYKAEQGFRAINPDTGGDLGVDLPVIILGDYDDSSQPLTEQAESVIASRGAGLILVVPDPTRPELYEFMAYESVQTLYFRMYEYSPEAEFPGTPAPAPTVRFRYQTSPTPDSSRAYDLKGEIKVTGLNNIHRGLLDSGIHNIPWGAKIYFLTEDSPAYDLVDFDTLDTSVTYFHQARGLGGETPLSTLTTPSSIVTNTEVQRRNFPIVPKEVKIGGATAGVQEAYNSFGSLNFSGGDYNPEFVDINAENLRIDWVYHNVNDDYDTLLFYDEASSTGTNANVVKAQVYLFRTGATSSANEREADALAYWRIGKLPGSPRTDLNPVTTYPLLDGGEYTSVSAGTMEISLASILSSAGISSGSSERFGFVEIRSYDGLKSVGTRDSACINRFMFKFNADLTDPA